MLGFPRPAALWRPLISGGLRRLGPLPRRVSRFPLAYAGFAGPAPPITGGVGGIRGGVTGLYGRPPVCRSNPVGSRGPDPRRLWEKAARKPKSAQLGLLGPAAG